MTKKRHIGLLMIGFALIAGFVIGALVWFYLKASNVGITLIWDKIAAVFPPIVYRLVVCLVGGLIIGLFHKKYGPVPENMGEAVNRALKERSYPYRQLPIMMIAAMLSILFGGAVGPEAGLVCLLLSLCFWAKDEFGMARQNLQAYIDNDPNISGSLVFRKMLKEMFTHPGRVAYDVGKLKWKRRLQIGCGVAAGLGGLFVYVLFNSLMGRAFTLPHIEGGNFLVKDWLVVALLLAVGIVAGYAYLIMKKAISWSFEKLRGKGLEVLNAVLGGLILGLISIEFPFTMFSGCTDIQALAYGQMSAYPYVLITIGLIKLFLTNVCIESGWRGGHFFPLLFSGLSIGYGFAGVFGTNQVLCVVIVTGALLGTVFQQPFGALVLCVIFFPLQGLGWMIISTFVGGCIPLPAKLRKNPENKGFVYNTIHIKERNLIPTRQSDGE